MILLLEILLIFTWDASPEPDIAGYKFYSGMIPRMYSNTTFLGNVTRYELSAPTRITYYTLTAIDFSGNESGFGREVFYDPSTGIFEPTIMKPGKVGAYPNPFTEMIQFEGCEEYRIYNSIAQYVHTTKKIWRPQDRASGVYFVVGMTEGRFVGAIRIIKQ